MVFIAGFLLIAGFVYTLGRRLGFPSERIHLDTELSQLPSYAAYSLLRMSLAYLISLFFSILYGYLAATRPRAEGTLIALLDVLQSVPILGFFPVAVLFFVNVFNGSRIGVEVASIFLIFTSMAWNMALSVYESLKTAPKELAEAADMLAIHGWLKFKRTLFPICIPKLVYSSMMSWAAGWYFLIACEIIAIGPVKHHLPGLGSFLIHATESGHIERTLFGLAVLVFIIVLVNSFIWRPLSVWGEKFRYEFVAPATAHAESFALRWYRIFLYSKSFKRLAEYWRSRPSTVSSSFFSFARQRETYSPFKRIGPHLWKSAGYALLALVLYGVIKSLVVIIGGLAQPFPSEAREIPVALLASFVRLGAAYCIALAWTLPVAYWVGENRTAFRIVTPLAEIGAAIPATALFPFFILLAVNVLGGMNGAAVLLILTGMQWYLLFNLIGGVQSIPADLKEAARALGFSRGQYWRKVYLPAVFPSLVTGSITAWGGGWNALIVSEYIVYRRETYSVVGLGAMLDRATYEVGDEQMLLLTLITMILAITLLNRFFWRRLYHYAIEHYRIDY